MINYILQVYRDEDNSTKQFKISAPLNRPLTVGTTIKLGTDYYYIFESDLLHGELEAHTTNIIEVSVRQ